MKNFIEVSVYRGTTAIININEIVCVEKRSGYTEIYLTNGNSFSVYESTSDIKELIRQSQGFEIKL